jgi:prepilin-type processing-associated H-X9-DG protein/prepilin-type N-terminal cleavage/methylation domain-containing protein
MKKISRQGGCHDASPRAGAAAFTLVELLVVIAIIALLVGMLAPSLGAAKEYGRAALCLTNLRQMAVAAQTYAACNRDYYPPAYSYSPDWKVSYAWDYVVRKDAGSVAGVTVEPGLLWQGEGPDMRIHQCPSFRGASNSPGDPYTGYNYNTSYIGHGQYESIPSPARVEDVKAPGQCALFGDGQYAAGANKFMRAPRSNPGDAQFSDSFRYSGTQGYRHLNRTNVAFCDGHATAWGQRHTANLPDVIEGTGFLSGDNAMYDTE